MYYLKYNGIDLTQLVKVREVSLPSLPSIDHDSVDMWNMDGNVFSSLSYGNRVVEIIAIIQPLDPNELEVYVNDVKRAFYVREPQPLFLGDETKYLLAVPEGDVEVTELGKGTCEINVTLVAYSPYWIAKEVRLENFDGKEGAVINRGDVPTSPVINIGIKGDTTFVQLEKSNTKERILIGAIPRATKPTVKEEDLVLHDECNSMSGWVSTQLPLGAGCSTGGALTTTSDGSGIMLGTVGGNGTWKGASYRKNLDIPVKDFRVRVNFTFNSVGTNGDPTDVRYPFLDNQQDVLAGTRVASYTVTGDGGGIIRSGPGTNYARVGCYGVGHVIFYGTVIGSWLEHVYNDQVVYVSMDDVTINVMDGTTTATLCNFVTNKATIIRAEPSENSTGKCTIPAGTVVRCQVDEFGEGTKFRGMWTLYMGYSGFIKSADLTRASDMSVTYPAEAETADDKTGIAQVYGYSANGVQLFSLSLIDESPWYEAMYPMIKVNGKEFLTDGKVSDLKPVLKPTISSNTIKYENALSGRAGNWQDFHGDLYIERKNNTWYAFIVHYAIREVVSTRVFDTSNSEEELAYLVAYMGTMDDSKRSSMSINDIKVAAGATVEPSVQNVQRLQNGDVVEIDFGIPTVKVNGMERNDLVDIGSQFFQLDVGQNDIKIASDNDVNFGVTYNEKFL